MKTLDEVIKALEENGEIDLGCVNCVYADCCGDDSLYDDALHYLKEYRTLQYGYIKAMADLEDNPPLTWSELKQMEGKPVWVEPCREWMLITLIEDSSIWLLSLDGMDYDLTLHDGWQAYRKERK